MKILKVGHPPGVVLNSAVLSTSTSVLSEVQLPYCKYFQGFPDTDQHAFRLEMPGTTIAGILYDTFRYDTLRRANMLYSLHIVSNVS